VPDSAWLFRRHGSARSGRARGFAARLLDSGWPFTASGNYSLGLTPFAAAIPIAVALALALLSAERQPHQYDSFTRNTSDAILGRTSLNLGATDAPGPGTNSVDWLWL